MQKIKIQIKETKLRLLTFEEQCAYEHIKTDDKHPDFINACKKYLENNNISNVIHECGDLIDGMYYNMCEYTTIRNATLEEITAYHYLSIIGFDNEICQYATRPKYCDGCLFTENCIGNYASTKISKKIFDNKDVIITLE